ncbi:MAG: DUF952 domain-containing protein [Caldilineae bacterium]|nr:DUF952 domain-containing protein [Caldilineae bacterium]
MSSEKEADLSHRIVHVAQASDWARARLEGAYRPASLALEGYVHFSTPWQVPRIADGNFPGRDDLVALVVDPERLGVELRYENCEGGVEPFPHVYGPIDLDAVIEAIPLEWDARKAGYRFPDGWRPGG